jgi:hypothetical protein
MAPQTNRTVRRVSSARSRRPQTAHDWTKVRTFAVSCSEVDLHVDGKNKISVVLAEPDFLRFDAYCSEKGFKKSTLIARLIREHLDHEGFRALTPSPPAGSTTSRARATKKDRSRGTR